MNKREIYFSIILILLVSSFELNAQYDLTEEYEKIYLQRQPTDKIMALLGIKPGMTIGEIGAGRGRMTVYFAREVGPSGKIFANDLDDLSLSYLRGRCRRLGFRNVEIVKGVTDDPLLPEKSLDMAVMVLVYHMIEKPDLLLENIKRSLKPGATLMIIDPVDAEIDREFGIDRSKPDVKTLTIRERIAISAKNSGYQLTKVDTTLSSDIIFTLKPVQGLVKIPAGATLVSMILNNNIKTTRREFERMKKDTLRYDLSEIEFRKAGYEFIGSRSYPEAVAVLEMGIELYPESAMLYAEMGEAYLMQGDKEKSLESWKHAAALDPENPNGKYLIENFDTVFNQIHPPKK
jgi:ubiquinone/menaquinone biosynthesis C-methylase UbiE